MENMEEFRRLGLTERALKILSKKGFTIPTTIQEKAIPILLEGKKDIIGQSQTGTGKTVSFALPIIEKIKPNSKSVQAIVLTPTRELAIQVAEEINTLKEGIEIEVLAVYGGSSIENQRKKLREGVSIVVGTPGRVLDLLKRKSLKIDSIKYFVLDEADEMLNMGFLEDIESILKTTPKEKSMLLFSATMPDAILKIAKKYMRHHEFIKVEKTNISKESISQIYYSINSKDRIEALRRIIDYHSDFYGIIFCNTKLEVDTVFQKLSSLNYSVAAIHGDIIQSQREKILGEFRKRKIKILIATDVAARGIDVNDLTHVVNFSLPQSPESYIHRIGRTGRAGKKGISITFVSPSEKGRLKFVERINNCTLKKEELPSIKDIITNKESRILESVKNIIDNRKDKKNKVENKKDHKSKYDKIAEELLSSYTADNIISALIKYSFEDDLNIGGYKEITEPLDNRRNNRSRNNPRTEEHSRNTNSRRDTRSRTRSSQKRPRERNNSRTEDRKKDNRRKKY